MSSMTLKEFMTRGNGGMEKRAVGFAINNNYASDGGDFLNFAKDNPGLLFSLLQQLSPEDLKALGIDLGSILGSGINSLIPGSVQLPEGVTKMLNAFSSDKAEDREKYWYGLGEQAPEIQKKIISNLSGLLDYGMPKILGDNEKFFKRLDNDTSLKLAFGDQKPSEAVRGLVDQFRNMSSMNPFLLGLAKNNPGLFKAFAHKYILQAMMKQMGMDPRKVYEYAPNLASYDMNQHIPGMALAFGLPFGIGAITGHPGWGALLGLLGAGGYGYYQYNKMQGQQHPFNLPPDKQFAYDWVNSGKEPEGKSVDVKQQETAAGDTSETTEPLPAPPDSDVDNSTTETGPVSKAPGSGSPTTTTQTTPNPVQPVIDPGQAGDEEDLGWDALEIDFNDPPEQSQPDSTNTSQAKPAVSPTKPKNQLAAVKAPTPSQAASDFSTPPEVSTQGLTPNQIAGADAFIAAYNQPTRDEITRQRNMQLYGSPTAPAGANTPIAPGQKSLPVRKPVG